MTTAYHFRERGAVYGSAASRTTPANSIAIRETLEPICESTRNVASVPTPYTADAMRTVFQSDGTRKKTTHAKMNGPDSVATDIGWVPENGNSRADSATTTTG